MASKTPKLREIVRMWRGMAHESSFACDNSERQLTVRNYVPLFKGDVVPRSIEDITLTAQKLCEEYMEGRLRRSGLIENEVSDGDDSIDGSEDTSSSQTPEYATMLLGLGQILEMRYPKLYSKVSVHLKVSFQSEVVVWDVFNKVANSIFGAQVTWARLLAFYAFAGGLGVDCVASGKPKLLGRIVSWFGHFVFRHVAFWIQQQGGWDGLAIHFKSLGELPNDEDSMWNGERLNMLWSENKDRFSVLICWLTAVAVVLIAISTTYTTWQVNWPTTTTTTTAS